MAGFFFHGIVRAQTSPNYEDSTPVCETGRKATKVGGWLQLLSYAKLD